MILGQSATLQYIDGTFSIENELLNFVPMATGRSESRTFKLVFEPGTHKVDYLNNANNNKYSRGKCHENTINMKM